MKTTTQIKILPTKEQEKIVKTSLNKYIFAVNKTVSRFVYADEILEISSKDIDIDLPSALRGQIILDSKSIFKKYKKELKKAEYKNNKNPAKDRKYQYSCGFKKHRDIVGAMNIINAPVVSGNRKSA